MPDSSTDTIRHALTVAKRHGFVEVDIETAETSFHAKLSPVATKPSEGAAAASAELDHSDEIALGQILAQLVGYYQPVEPPLVPGQIVAKGDVVAVIAALGLANDVESSVSGEVTAVLVQTGQSVEFGQLIAEVRQAP